MDRRVERSWDSRIVERARRLARAETSLGVSLDGKCVAADQVTRLLEAVIAPFDRVCLEGNNQKQADFLARTLAAVDVASIHHLHMVQSVLALPEHLDVFDNGIASRLDFSFSGPQGTRLAKLVAQRRIQIGAIHTYLELFGRYFIDLTPQVALVAAQAADRHGNLFTGPNTEDTPAIAEATAFGGGIVVAQVNEMVRLPRVDIPATVDFVVRAPLPPSSSRSSPATRRNLRDPGTHGDDGDQGDLRRNGSTMASASTRRRSSCCCRPTANHWACAARSACTGRSIRIRR